MDRQQWDERYRGAGLVWSATPNQFVVAESEGLTPGTAVDLACGEGRNAVWLAEQGWSVTGVDFSAEGLAKGARLAASRGVEVTWELASVDEWEAPAGGVDLVVMCYLQLPRPERSAALDKAAAAVAPGGTLVVVAHDRDNLVRGFGGPPSEDVLYDVADVVDAAESAGLTVCRADQAIRVVETEDGPREAIDTVVRASRTPVARTAGAK
ncbi:MAG TPA: class I SAM-dependent methyltransferase [Acidimicrobiales bacterium]|nr:class I SAM-dependent methyltransferase [Acidimicrobiales bacterium]